MMTNARKKSGGGYTGAYLMGKGTKAPTKAARVNVTFKAFIEAFVNGSWAWTRYFCPAICENIKVGHATRVLRPPNDSIRNDALISVPIGAIEAMISFRIIYEIKNVLHKVRKNPQAA